MGCSASRLPGRLDLYYMPMSAPCRSVMLTAHALNLKLNLKLLDLMSGEHLKPEFIKINPQHCIPTLDDEGFVLWESRAICAYLVSQYGQDDRLYPRDPRKRALVDSRLNFDQGVLFQRFVDNDIKVFFFGQAPDAEKKKMLLEAFSLLNTFLEGQEWVAGDHMTIADLAIVTSISTTEIVGYDMDDYPNIARWLAKAKTSISGYEEINQKGVDMLGELFNKMKSSHDHNSP